MRTVRLPGGCLPRGCLPGRGCLPRGCLARGVSAWGGVWPGGSLPGRGCLPRGCLPPTPPPWTESLTHAFENITFPQLLLRTVKIEWCIFSKLFSFSKLLLWSIVIFWYKFSADCLVSTFKRYGSRILSVLASAWFVFYRCLKFPT